MANTSSVSRELTIPSDPKEAQRAQEEILTALRQRHYTPHEIFGIRLALEEALVNAIRHGNGMDRSKTVRISYAIREDEFQIQIEDEGRGFDPSSLPDPTAPENLEQPSGRGIMLMRSFMNSVSYNPRGNRVTMLKYRENSQAE